MTQSAILAAYLARGCHNIPEQVASVADTLVRLERAVRATDEAACNGEVSDARMAERDANIAKAEAAAAELYATLEHNPDPRGATFVVRMADGRSVVV